MTSKNLMVFLVMALALVAFATTVSAADFGQITAIEVDGQNLLTATHTPSFDVGDVLEVKVTFTADEDADYVRVRARFSGENEVESGEFPVYAGNQYTRTLNVPVAYDFGEDGLDQVRSLKITVDSRSEGDFSETVNLVTQREGNNLAILAVDMQPEVSAGESLAMDVVLKNKGSYLADDVFLYIRIPELGLATSTYYGDLSAEDQGGLNNVERDDAVERRTFLRIPVNVPAGFYTVVFEASDGESTETLERRILITGASENGALTVPSQSSKTFSVGETAEFKLSIVNRGSTIAVYLLDTNAPADLNVRLSDNVLVVPAGSSRTVSIFADSSVRDDYTFSVIVNSEEGALVTQETFTANVVEGGSRGNIGGSGANATVLLTVILAIIFIVLLVVLIVLLTRKPETKEEFGESYY